MKSLRLLKRAALQAFRSSELPCCSSAVTVGCSYATAAETSGRKLEPACTASYSLKHKTQGHYYSVPGRDVYKLSQEQWHPQLRHVPKQDIPQFKADWLEGEAEQLQSQLEQRLGLTQSQAAQLVKHAEAGEAPDDVIVLTRVFRGLQQLEDRFPGFNAASAILEEPRLLQYPAAQTFRAMLIFQDNYTRSEVGPMMSSLGRHIISQPAELARRLFALEGLFKKHLGIGLPVQHLNKDSRFLSFSPATLDSHVQAFATIFGQDNAADILTKDINLLQTRPEVLNNSLIALRQVFTGASVSHVNQLVAQRPHLALNTAKHRHDINVTLMYLEKKTGLSRKDLAYGLIQRPGILDLSRAELEQIAAEKQLVQLPSAQQVVSGSV